MKDEQKTKKQLVNELKELRQKLTEMDDRSPAYATAFNAPMISAERYLGLIETIQEGLGVVDEEEKIIFVNEPFCVILDYLEEELIGMNLLELVPEKEKYKILEATQLKRETGEATRYELQLIQKGGRVRDVLVSTSPLFYEDNDYATLGLIIDITERKRIEKELQKHRDNLEELVAKRTAELRNINQALETEIKERKLAEEALRESEEKYRTFIQNFKGIAFRSDLNFVAMFIHGAVEEITGYTESEFTIGQPSWDQIIHPDDFPIFFENAEETRTIADYSVEHEYRIIRKDGAYRWVLETIQNVCDEMGEPTYVQGTIYDITKRKIVEEALRDSEEKHRDLVENINDGISSVNSQGIITYASPVFERITGLAPNEIVGKHINEFVYGPDTELSGAVFKRMLSGAGPMEADIRLITKRGAPKWVRIAARRAFYHNEELILRCVISDIDERKRAEEELRIKDTAIASSVNGITLTNLNGINAEATYVNDSCVKMWGYENSGEIIGEPITDFYENKRDLVKIMRALRDNGEWVGEINALRKDGSTFPLHLSASMVRDETGKPLCTISSYIDLSDLKLADEALRESEERYRTLQTNVPIGIFRTTPGGDILSANPALARMLAYQNEEELIGLNAVSFYKQPVRRREFSSLLTDNFLVKGFEVEFTRRDGSDFWCALTAQAIFDDNANLVHIDGIVEDITERKQTDEQLKKSLTEKEVLLKEINHRVKNNLNVVASILNLQARYVDNEVARTALLDSRNRIMTMANIHKLLYGTDNLASIEFGDYVRQLTINLVKSSVPNLNDTDIEFELGEVKLNVNSAIPCSLIINELISNSLKHAFPKGTSPGISIVIDKDEDGTITLIVADKGIGFPDDIDFRNTETLGMQLVDALVKQLDGTIELDRREGTKFTILFNADNDA